MKYLRHSRTFVQLSNSLVGTFLSITTRSFPATILTFHAVSEPSEKSCLETVIQTLAEEYRVVSLSQLVCWLKAGSKFPARIVVLTFDDGFKDQFLTAVPMLKQYNLPACFFVVTDAVSAGRATWKWKRVEGVEMMSWSDIRQLVDNGFEIGSHTCSHPMLSTLPIDEVHRELRVSKEAIEQHTGQEVRFFAYPFGGRQHIDSTCIEEVKTAGFECCLSAYGGVVFPNQDRFGLRRVSITSYNRTPRHLRRELNPLLSMVRTVRDDLRAFFLDQPSLRDASIVE